MTEQIVSNPASTVDADTLRRGALKRTAVYYAAFIGVGMSAASLGPTLPGLAGQTASSLGAISALFALRAIGRLIGTAFAGQAYDRFAGHPLIAASVVGITTAAFLTSLIPMLWLMIAVFFMWGFAEGFMDVGLNTLLIWTHREKSPPFINGLHLCFGIGAFLIPIIIAQIITITGASHVTPFLAPFITGGITVPSADVVWVYRFLALIFVPVALILITMPSPRSHVSDPQADDEPAVADAPVSRGLLLLFAVIFLLYVGAEASFSGWIYTYALRLNLATPESAAYLVSLFWLMVMLGRVVAMGIAAYVLPRTILIVSLLIGIAGTVLMILMPHLLWAGTILIGIGLSTIFPTTLAFASRNIRLTGKITSYFYLGAGTGVMIMPWLIGQLIQPFGAAVLLWFVLGALLLKLGILWLILRALSQSPSSSR
ncbi:MAG: MFS transporter [Anaerolineaceae bacterium]|nr:MAG: MFS transporter [Anaerolineaceae bacterium]